MEDENLISGIEDSPVEDDTVRGIREVIANKTNETLEGVGIKINKAKSNIREINSNNPIGGAQYIQSLLDTIEANEVSVEMLTSIFGTGNREHSELFLEKREIIDEYIENIRKDLNKKKFSANSTLVISMLNFYVNLLDYKKNIKTAQDRLLKLDSISKNHEKGNTNHLITLLSQSYDIILLYWKDIYGEEDIEYKIKDYQKKVSKKDPIRLRAPIKVIVRCLDISLRYKEYLKNKTTLDKHTTLNYYQNSSKYITNDIKCRKGVRHGAQFPYLSSLGKLLTMSDKETVPILIRKILETVGAFLNLDIGTLTQRVLGENSTLDSSICKADSLKIYNELVYIRLSKVNDPLYATLYSIQLLQAPTNKVDTVVKNTKDMIKLLRLCKPDNMPDNKFEESGIFQLCSKTLDALEIPKRQLGKGTSIQPSSSLIPFLKPGKNIENVSQILLPHTLETVLWESIQFRINTIQGKVNTFSGTLEDRKAIISLAIQEIEKIIMDQTGEQLRVGQYFTDMEKNSILGGFKGIEQDTFVCLTESILQVISNKPDKNKATLRKIPFGSGIGGNKQGKHSTIYSSVLDPRYYYDKNLGTVLIIDRGQYNTFSIDQENFELVINISQKLIKLYEELEDTNLRILHKDILSRTTIDLSKLSISGIQEDELTLLWSKFIEGDTDTLGSGMNILKLIGQKESITPAVPFNSRQLNFLSESLGVSLEDMKQISLFSYLDKSLQAGESIPNSFFELIVEIYQADYRTFLRKYKEYKALMYQLGTENPKYSVYHEGGHIPLNKVQKVLSDRKLYFSLLSFGVTAKDIEKLLSARNQWGLIDSPTKDLDVLIYDSNVTHPESSQQINSTTLNLCIQSIKESVNIQKYIETIVKYYIKKDIYNTTSKEFTSFDLRRLSNLYENISTNIGVSQFKHYIRHIETLGDQKELLLFNALEKLLLDINPDYEKGLIVFTMNDSIGQIIKMIDIVISSHKQESATGYENMKRVIIENHRSKKLDNSVFVDGREKDCKVLTRQLKGVDFRIRTAPSERAGNTARYYSTSLSNRQIINDTSVANPNKSIIARYSSSLDEKGRRLGFDQDQLPSDKNIYSEMYRFENHPISKETELYVSHGSPIKTRLLLYELGVDQSILFNTPYTIRIIGGKLSKDGGLELNHHSTVIDFFEKVLGVKNFSPNEKRNLVVMEERVFSILDMIEIYERSRVIEDIIQEANKEFGEGSRIYTYIVRLLKVHY